MNRHDISTASALFTSAFFDELIRCGVQDVVVSPGSRSTALSMVAHESTLRLHVDVDERGAAFFALGIAKASGRPVCLVCTSGTAVANYYPAVLEAESSRVPLILLTGDRPPRLQNLGAPQTCDQLNLYGSHVRHFQQMPLPGATREEIAFARQMALTAFSKAVGGQASESDRGQVYYGSISDAGPVHFNFPFEEPLKPNLEAEDLFTIGRRNASSQLDALFSAPVYPEVHAINRVKKYLQDKRTVVLCGEGSCSNRGEAEMLVRWAQRYQLPLLADPLSNLRSFADPLIIDNYDNLFNDDHCREIELVIRFGRYPVSKPCFSALAQHRPTQIVVDALDTRDFNATTDSLVRCTPAAFVASFMYDGEETAGEKEMATPVQRDFAQRWIERNDAAATRIDCVSELKEGFEGVFIHRLFDLAPEGSCIFSASSMAIRMIDTFYLKRNRALKLFCNRGLNGIDGCVSSALGAAQEFDQTTFVTGDLALIHDINALCMQKELLANRYGEKAPSVIVMLINNQGGGIFETLPQQSSDEYFERLFLTPQNLDFKAIAQGFKVPYAQVNTVEEFEDTYIRFTGKPGINVIEIPVSSEGLKERYGDFLA